MTEATESDFASLGPSLLARKGAARPAMRPQLAPLTNEQADPPNHMEDLGWNDMGDETENKPTATLALTPAPSPGQIDPETTATDEEEQAKLDDHVDEARSAVRRQQEQIEQNFTAPAPPVDQPEVPQNLTVFQPEKPASEASEKPDAGRHAAHSILSTKPSAKPQAGAIPPDPQPLVRDKPLLKQPVLTTNSEAVEPDTPKPATTGKVIDHPAKARKRRPNGSALANGRRAAFTLRLDAERHLKLRLASTIRNKSAQQIVLQALDKALAELPELESLASQVNHQ